MASKQVTDRQKSARAVVAAAETHAADIAAGFERELSRHIHKGETLPDVELLVRLIGRRLHADANTLVDADQAHEQELSDDAGPRDARDTAMAPTASRSLASARPYPSTPRFSPPSPRPSRRCSGTPPSSLPSPSARA